MPRKNRILLVRSTHRTLDGWRIEMVPCTHACRFEAWDNRTRAMRTIVARTHIVIYPPGREESILHLVTRDAAFPMSQLESYLARGEAALIAETNTTTAPEVYTGSESEATL
jgi:hypothetical protein